MRPAVVVALLAASCAAPLVQISAGEPRPTCGQSIVVIGAVSQPGRFRVDETRTLLAAIDRAGGFTKQAQQDAVVVERCTGDQLHVTVTRVTPGSEGDLALRQGDIVHVPTL